MLILSCLVLLCLLLVVGISVPMAFGAVLILIAIFGGHDVSGFLPAGHWKLNTVILLAIPLFILAGSIMERGKIAAPLVDLIQLMVGRLRGGLSAAGVVACAVFGSISGSAAATLTCIGSIMMPHLRKGELSRRHRGRADREPRARSASSFRRALRRYSMRGSPSSRSSSASCPP